MARKRERRSTPARPYLRVPIAQLISVDRAVEEGMLIARSALTMEVKNRIIVSAVRDNQDFDAAETAHWVGLELATLAKEQAGYAERMNHLAQDVTRTDGSPRGNQEYGPRDYRLLTRRGLAYASLSNQLSGLVEDISFVASVVEDARGQAWSELGSAIGSKLDFGAMRVADVDYETERESRLQAFLSIDLALLQRHVDALT